MLSMRITDAQTTHIVTTRPWTVRQWELRNKTKLSRIEQDGIGMDDYLFMAWRQLTDDGVLSQPFDQWGPQVVAVELDSGEDDPARPTTTAPSAG